MIQPFFKQEPSFASNPTKHLMATKLHNEVRVYIDKYEIAQLAQLVAEYLSIWKFENFV